jgi:hypothetical protein
MGDGFDREIRVCNTDLEDWQPVFDGCGYAARKTRIHG